MSESDFQILALDDEPEVLRGISRLLRPRGFAIDSHHRAADALDSLRDRAHRYDAVLLDLDMSDRRGISVLADIRSTAPALPVIGLTGDHGAGAAALKGGAFNILVKPLDAEGAARTLSNACRYRRLERRADQLERQADTGGLVGDSAAMRTVYQLIERVASTDVSVLIRGEPGTGKELVARRIHQLSPRAGASFVSLSCGAFPEALLDGELFGHERGAFTGAGRARSGAFVEAEGGTLFLDDVDELPIAVQPRLLRALQEGAVHRVGDAGSRAIDARVIAATSADLLAAVEANEFREDLYYRLNVVTIALPALRDRLEDLPALLARVVAAQSRERGHRAPEVSRGALAAMLAHDWPGNVRELEGVVRRALALCDDGPIEVEHLPRELGGGGTAARAATPAPTASPDGGDDPLAWTDELSFKDARKRAQTEFEVAYLRRLLEQTDGNVSEAARRAGLDRSNFRRILTRLDIKPSG